MSRSDPVPLPIKRIAEAINLTDDDLEPYGRCTAKIRLNRLPRSDVAPKGKLILVTATTPTSHGEGKTVVSIGLAQALEKLGKRSIVTLREPSLGPVFGVKGGATGGGKSQVLPREKINLHFNGDKHAVAAAHNLLAAIIDSHLYHGNELGIDPGNIFWPRTVDMNDRALRQVTIGLGGKGNGVPRQSRFVITAASEVMAILALAASREDCARRLSEISIGFDLGGRPVRTKQLNAAGAMMVLLHEAIMPNLVQTTEHTPALIHAGPFANIAHGTSSVIAQRVGLELAEYVVNETGFGADLGAEKFLDIVMPASGLKPSAAVLVTTVRGVRHQSRNEEKNQTNLKPGLENLAKHAAILRKFHLPTVVALNRFSSDNDEDIRSIQHFCAELGVESAVAEVFNGGGEGALELAGKVVEAAAKANLDRIKPLYLPNSPIENKISLIAREIYGASSVHFEPEAKRKIETLSALGFAQLPVCMAKTQYSLSDDPKKFGAPTGWTLTITDADVAAGAGFIVAVAGNMMLMPGLPRIPQAVKMRLNEDGSIAGLT
ncbi:MAG TPA: formate--tetrahydrofolate ligase [Candidatus Binatia bacterium]|nr:formate--tetrahydrofolate ligase [Candidatus Binatia bacterium]